MTQPRVPGGDDHTLELACGETVGLGELDLGMREFDCDCGETHAVVMDVTPRSGSFPSSSSTCYARR